MFAAARVAARARPQVRTMCQAKKPKAEGSFNWLGDPGTYPVLAVIGVACSLAAGKLAYDSVVKPEVHFGKSDRKTVDYIENNRTPRS